MGSLGGGEGGVWYVLFVVLVGAGGGLLYQRRARLFQELFGQRWLEFPRSQGLETLEGHYGAGEGVRGIGRTGGGLAEDWRRD